MSETDVEEVEEISMADVLNGEETKEVTEPKGEEAKEPEAKAEEETVSAEEKPSEEEPPSSEDARFAAMLAKSVDEVGKRQTEVARADKAEAELAALKAESKTERPDLIEDPDGFAKHLEKQNEQQLLKATLAMSESMVRSAHSDYDEKKTAYDEALKVNPFLDNQALQHPNPHLFVYETGENWLKSKEISDPDWEVKIRADERTKIEAEQKEKAETSIPESLAGESSATGRNTPEAGDLPMEDILA